MNLRLKTSSLVAALLTSLTLASPRVHAGASSTNAVPRSSEGELRRSSGLIRQVDIDERTLILKTFWATRTYYLGDSCQVALESKPNATLADLKAGQQVEVAYYRYEGVRVATEILQQDERLTGFVASIDRTNRTFRVNHGWSSRTFTADRDTQLILREGARRPFDDLELGNRVTVTYLHPGDVDVATTIEQTSLEFEGRIESLNAREQSIQATRLLARHTFRLGDDCQIIVNGALGGELKDLRIGDEVTFHYDDIDGVLIANRIELETDPGTTP